MRVGTVGVLSLARLLTCAVVATLTFGSALADTISVQDWISLPDTFTARDRYLVPQDQLSTQTTAPLRFMGKVMDQTRPLWGHYAQDLRDYPNTLSCLPPSEQTKDPVNLLAFDWNVPGNGLELNVCVFRILASLKDSFLIADWFRYQGFRPVINNDYGYHSDFDDTRFGFDFIISSKGFHALRRGGWFYSLTGFDVAYAYYYHISFLPDGQLGEATFGSNSE